MKVLFLTFMFLSTSVFAEVGNDHVDMMLNQMVKENVISKTEADRAKIRLKSMSKDQWSQINSKAATIASRMPASEKTPGDLQSVDLDGAQFEQIQNDMKMIIPQPKQ